MYMGGYRMGEIITTVKKTKYWIDIYRENEKSAYLDGFWTAFLRRNISKTDLERTQFIDCVVRVVNKYDLPRIRISQPYCDRMVVFTNCDGSEITCVKNILMNELYIRDELLFWKASFESESNWETGEWLDLLNSTYSAYEKIIALYTKKKELKNIQIFKSSTYQKILEAQCMNRKSMVIKPVFSSIDYGVDENFIFILMPFVESWSDDVYHLIKSVENETGTIIKRADDFFEPNIVVDDIWKSINKAVLIIADITTHNANVFYELGIAHTLGKKVVLIRKKDGKAAPFDIKAWRYLEYDITPKEADLFKKRIVQIISSSIALSM